MHVKDACVQWACACNRQCEATQSGMHWKAAAKPNETWLSGQGVFQQSARWFIDEKALLLHHICNLE
eukprot:4905031-Amphidinium_carterae.1